MRPTYLITNYQTGYEHVFNNIPGLFIIKKPHLAVDVALYILSLTIEQPNELGFQGAEYARKLLDATVVYSNIVSVISEQLFNHQSPSHYFKNNERAVFHHNFSIG